MRQLTRFVAVIAIGVLAFSACSMNDEEAALDVTEDYVQRYNEWAQGGYLMPIPDELNALVTDDAEADLESDGRWYSRGGVRQVGSLVVVKGTTKSSNGGEALIELHVDASGITVTAEGQDTWRSGEAAETQRVLDIRLKRKDEWVISSIKSTAARE
jgi:hypothetical protein